MAHKITVIKRLPLEIEYTYYPKTEHYDSHVSIQGVSLGINSIQHALTSEQLVDIHDKTLALHESEL